MARCCTVCAHADADKISERLIAGVPLDKLAKEYELTISALHRHKKHIPAQLAKAQEAQDVTSAESLMGRIAALNAKAEDIYTRAVESQNLLTLTE